jgi:hypothetical protein
VITFNRTKNISLFTGETPDVLTFNRTKNISVYWENI